MFVLYYLSNVFSSTDIITKWSTDYFNQHDRDICDGFYYLKTFHNLLESITENENSKWSEYLEKNKSQANSYLTKFMETKISKEKINLVIENLKNIFKIGLSLVYTSENEPSLYQLNLSIQEKISGQLNLYTMHVNSDNTLKYALETLGSVLERIYKDNENDPDLRFFSLREYIEAIPLLDGEKIWEYENSDLEGISEDEITSHIDDETTCECHSYYIDDEIF
ncbi:hypothetical protein H312_03496 [Anncaliia algerae PRA339]|uniref:Uncharacterized protein n=1 Tax=Anncaliia algerae PRA339 TaxID=1288291 RepID=A0A059EVT8_9MICR|nr:hypothetical protein H312_03496 [Anncaliia algerae PRA339]